MPDSSDSHQKELLDDDRRTIQLAFEAAGCSRGCLQSRKAISTAGPGPSTLSNNVDYTSIVKTRQMHETKRSVRSTLTGTSHSDSYTQVTDAEPQEYRRPGMSPGLLTGVSCFRDLTGLNEGGRISPLSISLRAPSCVVRKGRLGSEVNV